MFINRKSKYFSLLCKPSSVGNEELREREGKGRRMMRIRKRRGKEEDWGKEIQGKKEIQMKEGKETLQFGQKPTTPHPIKTGQMPHEKALQKVHAKN